jgi:hypothetical protein
MKFTQLGILPFCSNPRVFLRVVDPDSINFLDPDLETGARGSLMKGKMYGTH